MRRSKTSLPGSAVRRPLAVFLWAGTLAWAQNPPPVEIPPPPAPPASVTGEAAKAEEPIPAAQLEALVAPVALYPDELLGQVLVASTYPLELVQLQQWLAKNKGLKDKALEEAVKKQPWDPSIQGLAALPEVVKRLADDIKWTTDLGNAFLAQQQEVLDAVQRMRKKAQDNGALKDTKEQKVETKTVENQQVIIIQPANPEVIYVPSYNPVVVYGPPMYPMYPYPPIYYPPPPPPGAFFMTFTFGFMMGAAMHGGWGYGCGWHGGGGVYINHNNVYVNHNNRVNNIQGGGGRSNWQHNPQHRGAAPYPNNKMADKFGGGSRGGASASNRMAGEGGRGGSPSASDRSRGGGDRGGPSAGSADRVGGRDVGGGGRSGGGFEGGSRNYSGGSARAGSSRGASSLGGARGGGAPRGGGGRRR